MSKYAFLFGGQGSQYVGMGKDLFNENKFFRQTFEGLNSFVDFDLMKVCFDGPQETLNKTVYTQPSLMAISYASSSILTNLNIEPSIIAGFSLGEYTALLYSKVLQEQDAFRIIRQRAKAMQNAVPTGSGGMLIILGIDSLKVGALCKEIDDNLWISNYNCPGQIVVAGTSQALRKLKKYTDSLNILTMEIPMSVPSHCPLLQPAADTILNLIEDIPFKDSQIPIVMNYDGEITKKSSRIKENLIKQLTNPVQFEKSINTMNSFGVDKFIEMGAGRVLSGFVKKTIKGATTLRIENIRTLTQTLEDLQIEKAIL